jgi:GGDEF domain-containing protein
LCVKLIFVHPGEEYALIHVLDPARAAQYSALVEQHHLAGARARSEEEARFHAQRLGQASLIIAEVRQAPDGFDLLRRLRRGRRPQTAPALLISSSMKVRDEALRLRDTLDIVEVLSGSQPLSTVRAAVERAIRRGPRLGRAQPLSVPGQKPARLTRDETLEALARELDAPMAVAWLGCGGAGEIVGWFGWDRSLVPMIGEADDWRPFRELAQAAPICIADARTDALLQRSPLVRSGTVRSFAGAPLLDEAGQSVGALWIADASPRFFDPEDMEALARWTERLFALEDKASRSRAARTLKAAALEGPVAISGIPGAEAMEQLLAHSADGFIASDSEGHIAFSNPAAPRLLGLRTQHLAGMSRTRVLELLRHTSGLDPRTAAALASGAQGSTVVALKKQARVLRWDTQPLPLGAGIGRMDQIVDVTAEVQERDMRTRLARVDPLTWLANRRGFDEALAREISRALRFKNALALVLLRVECREGMLPAEAEQLLREVAWLVAEVSRGYDHSSRLEDDSIALVLPGEVEPGALRLVERLQDEVATLRRAKDVKVWSGVAVFDPGEEAGQMLARARAAMLASAVAEAEDSIDAA